MVIRSIMNKITKTTKKKNTGTRTHRKLAVLLIAVLITGALAGGLLAKYRSDNQKQAEMVAAQFHVTSDYLEEEGASYDITDWGDGFYIQLYNYEKENLALISAEDISYSVTVSSDKWKCEDPANGILKGDSSMQTNTLVISPKDKSSIALDDAVTVTVKTTAPFTKELSAKFTVVSKDLPDNKLVQSSEDNNQWHLRIKTNDYSGTVTVNWPPDGLCPDTTSEYMDTWMNNGTGSLKVQKNTTYDLVFFSNRTGSRFKLAAASGAAVSIQ